MAALSLPNFPSRKSFNYRKVKKVQEELLCAICLDFLEEPKLLQCAHSFCRKCLVELVVLPRALDEEEVRVGRVQCPNCRDYTSVLGGDVSTLRTNFKLANMVEIVSKEEKAEMRQALQDRLSVQTWQLPVCSQHLRPEEYYCSECEELLCRKCMIAGHRTHDFDEAETVLANRVSSLRGLVQPAWEAATKAEELERDTAAQRDSLVANSEKVKGEAKAFFERAREELERRESEVLRTIEAHASSRVEKLATWEAKLKEDRSRIKDTISEINTLVECASDVSIISKAHSIAEALNTHQGSILTISESLALHNRSSTRSLLTFDPSQSLDVPIGKLGRVKQQVATGVKPMREVPLTPSESSEEEEIISQGGRSGGSPSPKDVERESSFPPKSSSPEREQGSPEASQPSTLPIPPPSSEPVTKSRRELVISYSTPDLTYKDSEVPASSGRARNTRNTLPLGRNRQTVPGGADQDTVRLHSRKHSEPVLPQVQEFATGIQRLNLASELESLEDTLAPPTPVSATSSTSKRDSALIEEYFPHVEPPIMVFPPHATGAAADFQPTGVAIGQGNSIVACDVNKNVLKVIACSGRLIDTIGSEGKVTGQFRKPSAVTVNSEGTIFVADNGNSRIQKFSIGKFSSKFWQKTRERDIGDLWGIAVSEDGKIYASDWQNHCIHVFDSHGKHLSRLGADFLKLPIGIAINEFGNLLVADRDHHCIWVLSSEGQMLKQIGHKGNRPGELSHPYGIAVHQDGLVLVTETGNSRVSIFSQVGEFLTCFGDRGTELGQFNQPKHICVNSRGHVVIADELNHRIQVFDISPLISEVESKLLYL